MAKYALSFLELHNMLFMQGSNLGNKINASVKGLTLLADDERSLVWVLYKGKVSFIPYANIASGDFLEVPKDVMDAFSALSPKQAPLPPQGPPAVARGKKGLTPAPATEHDLPAHMDPNDFEAIARRQAVRAASANAFRAEPQAQVEDRLIQEARNQAMGLKPSLHPTPKSEQTSGPHLTGKKKIMSHTELQAQMAKESKSDL